MKAAVLALVVAGSVTLSAQIPTFPGCKRCGVVAFVDTPTDRSDRLLVMKGTWLVAGWGFECESGRPVDRVELFASNDDGFFSPVPVWFTRLEFLIPRPDVQTAFIPSCPNVERETGWHLVVYPEAVAPGAHVLLINVWRGPYLQQFKRTVVVR